MMHSNPHSPLILGLVDGLKRKSAVEFAGPCPWCGGEDRFVVWPNQGQGGRFMCRRCARSALQTMAVTGDTAVAGGRRGTDGNQC